MTAKAERQAPWWAWSIIAIAIAAACQSAPITHRPQLILMDQKTELALGAEIYHDIIAKAPAVKDARLKILLEVVGRRVAKAAGREDMAWEFNLLDDDSPNAFCLPGGKVAINAGILPLAYTEAGLAAIIAHEAGHAIARHGAERGGHAKVVELGIDLLDRGLGRLLTEKTKMRLAWGVDFLVSVAFPFSHTHELEADELGLLYMARAGYDPREAALFWERVAELEKREARPGLEFLSTHPTGATRLWKLRLLIPKAMKEYNSSPKLGTGGIIL